MTEKSQRIRVNPISPVVMDTQALVCTLQGATQERKVILDPFSGPLGQDKDAVFSMEKTVPCEMRLVMKEVLTESQSHTSAHILLWRGDPSFVRVMIFEDVLIRRGRAHRVIKQL